MQSLKERLGHIIFETDTPASSAFAVALLVLILFSVVLVMVESVASLRLRYGELLRTLEWAFTLRRRPSVCMNPIRGRR